MSLSVGVLALQGDFVRHAETIVRLGHVAHPVKTEAALDRADALIIPGGESTTIGKLLVRFGLFDPIANRINDEMPVFGTCAGTILLAQANTDPQQHRFGVLDIDVARNAYGRQVDSFESEFEVTAFDGAPFHGVFIRAPIITRVGGSVEVLATFEDRPVLVRSGRLLAATFHPELTDDDRIHAYFLEEVARA